MFALQMIVVPWILMRMAASLWGIRERRAKVVVFLFFIAVYYQVWFGAPEALRSATVESAVDKRN